MKIRAPQVAETIPGTYLVAYNGPPASLNPEAILVYHYRNGLWVCTACSDGACPHIQAAQAFIEKEVA